MAKKKTMYEILEVSPTASHADIKAAHKRLSLELMSGKLGISREDCNFRLNILDVALHTLSTPVLRDAYDAELASVTAPCNIALPSKTNVVSLGDEAKALKIVAAIADNYKIAAASMDSYQPQIIAASSAISLSARSLKTLLRIVIGLAILAFFIRIGQVAVAARQEGRPSAEVTKAEEKLIIQEYYKKHGVRPASRAEAEFLEQEYRRKDNERREAEFAEKKKDDEYRRFVDESRREGDRIHANLVRAEETERYEEMRRQRELAEEKRQQEEAAQEAERMRIENERRKLGLN